MLTHTTLRPGQKGTKGLTKKYGDRLVCVRYKIDEETGRKQTTVELIEDESTPGPDSKPVRQQKREIPSKRLGIRVEYWESEVRRKVKEAGGIWRPRHKLWEMRYDDVVALGLEARVVATDSTES